MAANGRGAILKQVATLVVLGLLAMAIGVGVRRMTEVPNYVVSSEPVPILASARFLVPMEKRAQYFARLNEFAVQNKFQSLITPSPLRAGLITMSLRREDLIGGGDNFHDPYVFEFELVAMPGAAVAPGVPEKLIADLERRVLAVPGLSIAPPR